MGIVPTLLITVMAVLLGTRVLRIMAKREKTEALQSQERMRRMFLGSDSTDTGPITDKARTRDFVRRKFLGDD